MSKLITITTHQGRDLVLSLEDNDFQEISKVQIPTATRQERNEVFDRVIDSFMLQAEQQNITINRQELITSLLMELRRQAPSMTKMHQRARKATMMAVLNQIVCTASGEMKMIFGCVNNMVLLHMAEVIYMVRTSPRYNQEVRHEFLRVIKDIKDYNRNLLYGSREWFSVKKMPENTRRIYGDITDSEYYDYWASLGGPTLTRCKDEINVLQNKFKLSMESHNISDVKLMSNLMVVQSLLNAAEAVYGTTINSFIQTYSDYLKKYHIDRMMVNTIWRDFSLSRIAKSWERAMLTLSIKGEKWQITEDEERNITLTIDQLCEKLNDAATYYQATMQTTEDFAEVFKSKGMQKKALREIAQRMEEALSDI